jgi:hypothetical protein
MFGILVFIVFIGLLVGFRFLPWEWKLGIAGVIAVLVLIFRAKLFIWLLMIPFRLKGATLRRARIEVHSITPTQEPPKPEVSEVDDFEESEQPKKPEEPRNYYLLEVTIQPSSFTMTPFKFWELGELCLVAPGEDVMRGEDPVDSCIIASSKFVRPELPPPPTPKTDAEEEDYEDDYGGKVAGPHRVQFVIGVKPGVQKLRFQYYFEIFGEVTLPGK